jgi:hypothetical protein
MNPIAASIFKVVLTVAALFTAPIYSFLSGHPVVYQIVEFVGALVALFMNRPTLKAKKPTEPDL